MKNVVYKYLPPERIDVIENCQIRLTQPHSLNDPFEYENLIDLTEFEVKATEVEIKGSGFSQVAKVTAERVSRLLLDEINKSIGEKFGIVSFTRNELSMLMWGHYAKSFTGFVVGFDSTHDFFRSAVKNLNKTLNDVVYTSKRRRFKIEELSVNNRFLCMKPIEWSYEEEIRFIDTLDDPELVNVGTDNLSQPIMLRKFPKELVSEIIIGSRTLVPDQLRLLKYVSDFRPDCPVYEQRLHESEYRIVKKRIG